MSATFFSFLIAHYVHVHSISDMDQVRINPVLINASLQFYIRFIK